MSVAQKVARLTLGQADALRRAMGAKKKSEPRQAVRRLREA
jgi:DNA polymerase III alpha subunit